MDKNKVAEVLENAARLYRDEKVEWCTGAWVQPNEDKEPDWHQKWDQDTQYEAPGLPLSVCAEGALLHAAGFGWNQIATYTNDKRRLLSTIPESGQLFQLAKGRLALHVRELTGKQTTVYSWNDKLDRKDVEGSKAAVIEAMEATAKDLRNGN